MDTSQLNGKVALVTGSGRGIGAGIALELASRGASIIVRLFSGIKQLSRSLTIIGQLLSQCSPGRNNCTEDPSCRWGRYSYQSRHLQPRRDQSAFH